ncbi:MAG: type II toxin-antitoxin system HicA family toxin [Candidatus Zambryskibacteria bacterium]|nr:type II toxin-antitoxin system HicA family toxin [Candidatus Zambryskibacteria bacterium]
MSKPRKTFSGDFVIEILIKKFDFKVVSQKGSHVKLMGEGHVTIVPLHEELARGTMGSVLKMAGIEKKRFLSECE